jgi:uncharacterized protein (DUF2147 family)
MKKISIALVTSIVLFFLPTTFAATQLNHSPIGQWKTIDDVTGNPKSIIAIRLNANQTLSGTVVQLLRKEDIGKRCIKCEGSKKDQPIVGMQVIENMTQNKQHLTTWENGSIFDPKNGKTYHCLIQVVENGTQLTVRGYIGLPLFGRTQTWYRV